MGIFFFFNAAASSSIYCSVSFPTGIFPLVWNFFTNGKKLLLGLDSNVTFKLFLKPNFIFCELPLSRLTVNVTTLLMPLFLEFLVSFKAWLCGVQNERCPWAWEDFIKRKQSSKKANSKVVFIHNRTQVRIVFQALKI